MRDNGTMLCLYQQTSMVNWSNGDHFGCDELLMLNNNHIEKALWHHIFPEHAGTFQKSFCHSCRKSRDRGVFSVENWSTFGFVVAATLRDQLRELTFVVVHRHVELTVVAAHNHAILILKTDICKAFISGLWKTIKHFLTTLDLLDIYIFCRLLSLWHWYLAYCKIKILPLVEAWEDY